MALLEMKNIKKYFEQLVYGHRFSEKYPKVEVHHLSKREFDHGGTRRRGVKYSDGEIFIFLTQDAMPVDEYLVEKRA